LGIAQDPEDGGDYYHLPSVMMHEMGHALGLSHPNYFDNDGNQYYLANSAVGHEFLGARPSTYDRLMVDNIYSGHTAH